MTNKEIRIKAIDDCNANINSLLTPQTLQLHAGELTADEVLTVRAILYMLLRQNNHLKNQS
jgi:hypothetical protein